jgi:hypothetical protein
MVKNLDMRRALFLVVALGVSGFTACAKEKGIDATRPPESHNNAAGSGGAAGGEGVGGLPDAGAPEEDGGFIIDFDAQVADASELDENQICASVAQKAETKLLPVDIIWMVDNSSSMAPAVAEVKAGLNAFAATIGASNLDYRVIMLSLRGAESPITHNGGTRYPVCIAPPLAGDDNCGDGPNFFQSSVDIKSTQPLEQLLGTLAQTEGYKDGQERGGAPWAAHLRNDATKTIVMVTDDNARLSATDFETFPGGKNPFNSLMLPPGILDPSWSGMWNGYLFSGIYGWGSDVDPGVICSFGDGTTPASPGPTYTTLVQKTGGVRAKLCDGTSAWQPFFDAVAQAVIQTSKLACNMPIPTPEVGTIDYAKINVQVSSGGVKVLDFYKVDGEAQCVDGGWYYNDPAAPTEVILCPSSCEQAQASVGIGKEGSVDVLFGCETMIK